MSMNVKKELKVLSNLPDESIDFSDIPEETDWSSAEKGKFYKPIKQKVTIRIDTDILDWFKHNSQQYQTAINKALRSHIKTH